MQNDRIVLISLSQNELQNLVRIAVREEISIAETKKNEKKLLNAKDICDFLGIHISTLNTWKAQGKIPFKRLGKRIFFDKKEVLSSLENAGNYYKIKDIK